MTVVIFQGVNCAIFVLGDSEGSFQVETSSGNLVVSLEPWRKVRGFCDPADAEVPLRWARTHPDVMKKHVQKFQHFFVANKPVPKVQAVAAADGRKVDVTWQSGRRQVIDLEPALLHLAALSPVRHDDVLFRSVRPGRLGATIAWADGSEMSALWVEEMGLAQMDNAEFRWAMESMGLSLDAMASHLGISRRSLVGYRKDREIPRTVALSTNYLLDLRGIERPPA